MTSKANPFRPYVLSSDCYRRLEEIRFEMREARILAERRDYSPLQRLMIENQVKALLDETDDCLTILGF